MLGVDDFFFNALDNDFLIKNVFQYGIPIKIADRIDHK